MTDLRDSAIWAATCDLKARVLPNARGPLVGRAVVRGVTLVVAGVVALALAPAIVGQVLVVMGLLLAALGAAVARTPGHLLVEADGFTWRTLAGRTTTQAWERCGDFHVVGARRGSAGRVAWRGADGGPGAAFLPGTGSLPPEDLAVLLNRYRQRFAPRAGDEPTAT